MYYLLYKNKSSDKLGIRNKELIENQLLTDDAKEKLFKSAKLANKLFKDNSRIFYVMDAFEELKELNENFIGVNRRWNFYITRRVRSYFLEVDIYIKHLERYMSKLNKLNIFKQITSKTYDEDKYYAISCILRNYIVHSQDILHEMYWDLSSFHLWVHKNKLLNDLDLSASKRKIINNFEEKIDILEIVNGSYNALVKVHESILHSLLTPETKEALVYLNDSYEKNRFDNNSSWYICRNDSVIPINQQMKIDFDVQNLYWDDYVSMKTFLV